MDEDKTDLGPQGLHFLGRGILLSQLSFLWVYPMVYDTFTGFEHKAS